MWITVKAADGDTLESLAKTHKIKKPDMIWSFGDNKKLERKYHKKGAFEKGDSLSFPDSKAKVALVVHKGKKTIIPEAEYNKLMKLTKKKMVSLATTIRLAYENTAGRHEAQSAINEERWVAAGIVGVTVSVPEPVAAKIAAQGATKQAVSFAKKGDVENFMKWARDAEKYINTYRHRLHKWIDAYTGNAGAIATGLEITRDASFIAVGVMGSVALAPAYGAVLAGGAATGGAAFVKSYSTELGKVFSGDKKAGGTESWSKISKDTAEGLGLGMLGSGMASKVAKNLAVKIAVGAGSKKVVKYGMDELNGYFEEKLKSAEKQGTLPPTALKMLKKIGKKIDEEAVLTVLKKTSQKERLKLLEKPVEKFVEDRLKKTTIKGKVDADKLADQIAKEFLSSKELDAIGKAYAKQKKTDIQSEIDTRVSKKAAALGVALP